MTSGIKIEFGWGTELDRDGNRISPLDYEATMKEVHLEAERVFGGYTGWVTNGGWVAPDGKRFAEVGYTLMVLVPSPDPATVPANWWQESVMRRVANFAAYVRTAWNQQAVAVTQTQVFTGTI